MSFPQRVPVNFSVPIPYSSKISKRFFWLPYAKQMLETLKQHNFTPTSKVSSPSSSSSFSSSFSSAFSDPDQKQKNPISRELEEQWKIERSFMHQITNDPAHYCLQEEAANNCQEFVMNGLKKKKENGNGNESKFFDIVKFRMKNGVALPIEIALAEAILTEEEIAIPRNAEQQEVRDVVRRLCGTERISLSWLDENIYDATSALIHASGIGKNISRNFDGVGYDNETLRSSYYHPVLLGTDAFVDRSQNQILSTGEHGNDDEKEKDQKTILEQISSTSFVFRNRLEKHVGCDLNSYFSKKNKDNKNKNKKNVTFLFFSSDMFDRVQGCANENASVIEKFDSFLDPVSPRHQFDTLFETYQGESQQEALARWQKMICIPKVSTLALSTTTTSCSSFALRAMHHKLRTSNNSLSNSENENNNNNNNIIIPILMQCSNSSGAYSDFVVSSRDDTTAARTSSSSSSVNTTGNSRDAVDQYFVENILLRSLPICGFTRGHDWQAVSNFLENFFASYSDSSSFGGELDETQKQVTVNVTVVSTPDNSESFAFEPEMKEFEKSLYPKVWIPKCVVESRTAYNSDRSIIEAGFRAVFDTAFPNSIFSVKDSSVSWINDVPADEQCPLFDILGSPKYGKQFLEGVETPVNRKDFAEIKKNWRKRI